MEHIVIFAIIASWFVVTIFIYATVDDLQFKDDPDRKNILAIYRELYGDKEK